MTSLKMPKVDKSVLKDKDKIVKDIANFISRKNILSEIEELKPYETDGLSAYKQTPMLVVLPENTDQVSKVLSYCNKKKIKVVVACDAGILSMLQRCNLNRLYLNVNAKEKVLFSYL